MDIGKSFGYVFEDPGWVGKVLIGGLGFILLFLPVFFTVFWSQQVAAHIWGQYARTAGGVASTVPPMSPTTPPPMAPTTPA